MRSRPLAKVPIGNHYHPERRHKPTWEELEIQGVLLRKVPGRRRLSDGFIAVACATAVILLGVIL